MRFEAWMAEVDRQMKRLCGMTTQDIADFCYADAFDAGKTPLATAKRALKADGYKF